MMKSIKGIVTPKSKSSTPRDFRLDVVASELFDSLSRKQIKKTIDAGGAYVNHKRQMLANWQVKPGDTIELFWNEESLPQQNHTKILFQESFDSTGVVFQHEDYFIINKPAGIPSQATLESSGGTILHLMSSIDSSLRPEDNLFLCHRLDKDTSGLMIVARQKNSQKFFEDCFRNHKIKKSYVTIVVGQPAPPSGLISFPIAKTEGEKNTYYAILNRKKSLPASAKLASTHYATWRYDASTDASVVGCFPVTGRTHQIRVHMQGLGNPVVADKTYAKNLIGHPLTKRSWRHLLHAYKLEFVDTQGVQRTIIKAPTGIFAEVLNEMNFGVELQQNFFS